MDQSRPMTVTGKDGLRGTIARNPQHQGVGDSQVLVRLEDGRQVLVPGKALMLQADGSYYLSLSLAELEGRPQARDAEKGEDLVLPVIVEELDVQKRKVETGRVRITKTVHEREEVVDEPLLREEVNVERVAVNRVVDGPVPVRYEGKTMVIPLLEEVLVVEKRLMLKEEMRITKKQVEIHKPQRVTLRSEEAAVERISGKDQEEDSGIDLAQTKRKNTSA